MSASSMRRSGIGGRPVPCPGALLCVAQLQGGIGLGAPTFVLREPNWAIALVDVRCYPSGLLFTLERVGLRESEWTGNEDPLSLTVTYPDRAEAALRDSSGMQSGKGPMVSRWNSSSSEGAASFHFKDQFWTWPLPSAGPFVIEVSFQGRVGSARLDGLILGTAAAAVSPWLPSHPR